MKDRIRQIMEAQHMTQQVFANYIGTTPATLSGIFNDRTRPTINIIESIKKKFPNISLDWLMFGNGQMYQSAISEESVVPHAPDTANHGQKGQESLFDFDDSLPPTTPVTQILPQITSHHNNINNSVKHTHQEVIREEIKYIDKPLRRVTEIRVYYDDQTWESFVPSKK